MANPHDLVVFCPTFPQLSPSEYLKSTEDLGIPVLLTSKYIIWMFPKNRATKWMVYFMENPIKMDDLGGFPPIFGNAHISPCMITWDFTRLTHVEMQEEPPQESPKSHGFCW